MMNNDQFASALMRGLGRTYIHLQQHESTPYHDILLHACLYNPVFDRQCEGSRAAYLFGLLHLIPVQKMFEYLILDAFAAMDETMDSEQLWDFVLRYAQMGNREARRLLYEQFADHARDGDDQGATHIIDLDGLEGFRFVATRLGEVAQYDSTFQDSDYLLCYLQARFPHVTDTDIALLATSNPALHTYLAGVQHTMAQRDHHLQVEQPLRARSYATLKPLLVDTAPPSYGRLRHWGKTASEEDITMAAHDFLCQDAPQVLATYLAIFAHRPFPLGILPLVPFVHHESDQVVRRTLDALSRFRDPQLHDLGQYLLCENGHNAHALILWKENYQRGDESLIYDLLATTSTDDALHAIGMDVLDILMTAAVTNAQAILHLLYERLPCSLCRPEVIKLLKTHHTIPFWMRHECQYDANPETRMLVQEDRSGE